MDENLDIFLLLEKFIAYFNLEKDYSVIYICPSVKITALKTIRTYQKIKTKYDFVTWHSQICNALTV